MANRRQKDTTKPPAARLAQAPPREPKPPVPAQPRRKIRVITNPPEPDLPQTTMGRAIRPFAKPGQSGTFAPFAVAQARRGR